ncbi:MAG TPA: glycosyltransferase 87 family protein [Sumerlaeia bacterium]|nr:glycosyltransferase 87 family protein [Sumerlaeia bacterium]
MTSLARYPVERVRAALYFPYQLDAEEGHILGQALRLAKGEGLYCSIASPPYLVDNYPPLYPALWSPFARFAGVSLAPGRWISAVAALAAALGVSVVILGSVEKGEWRRLLGWRTREAGEDSLPPPALRICRAGQLILLAWICPLLFLTSRSLLRWVAYTRVDLLAVALSVWGLAVFGLWGRRRGQRRGLLVAVFLFGLALVAKQTAIAAPAACFICLLLSGRRRAAAGFAGAMAGVVGLPILLFCAMTGGRYWLHTVVYNRNVMHWHELRGWTWMLWALYAPLLVAVAVLFLGVLGRVRMAARGVLSDGEMACRVSDGAAPSKRLSPAVTLYLPYLVINSFSLASLAKMGSAENYLLEPACAGAIFLGTSLADLLGGDSSCSASRATRSGPRPFVGGSRHFAAAMVLAMLPWHAARFTPCVSPGAQIERRPRILLGIELNLFLSAPQPTVSALTQGRRVVREIQARPGPVLCEDPIYALKAGRPVLFQHFIMTRLAAEGKWDEGPLIAQLKDGGFSLVVTNVDLAGEGVYFGRYSPAFRQAVRDRYTLLEKLDRKAPGLGSIFLHVPLSRRNDDAAPGRFPANSRLKKNAHKAEKTVERPPSTGGRLSVRGGAVPVCPDPTDPLGEKEAGGSLL